MKKLILGLFMAVVTAGSLAAAGISPEDVREMADARADFVIIDIRSADEYKAGHLAGARHVEWDGSRFVTDYRVYILSSTMPVVVVCTDGSKSIAAVEALIADGYTDVCYLEGGMQASAGILSASPSNIKSWHVIKSLFAGEPLPRLKRM